MISVLYIDDEPDLLELCKIYLERTGTFSVDCAGSSAEAFVKMHPGAYDALVVDYQMPGMDGVQFVKKLRESGDNTPCIIFTGKGQEEVVVQAYRNGADFYLQKGGDPGAQFSELAKRLKQAVELRMAEKARRKSEQRLQNIIDFLPDATLAIDREGRVIAWNRAIEEMTGVRAEEMLGKGDHEYALPFYGVRRPILIDLAIGPDGETEENYDFITRNNDRLVATTSCARPRGREAVLWCMATPLYDASGRPDGAIESIRDITDQKRAEGALRESEDNYRALFENATEGILIAQDDRIVHCNPMVVRMLGYPREVLGSIPFCEFIHPDDRAMVLDRFHRRIKGEEVPTGYEFRVITGHSSERQVRIHSSRIIWSKRPASLNFVVDITDRKLVEGKLRESEARYRELFSHMPTGVAIFRAVDNGEDFIITDFNEAAEQIDRIDRGSLIGRRVTDMFPDVKGFGLFEVFQRVSRTGVSEFHPASRYYDERIGETWRENRVYRLPSGDIIAIYSDITERKQIEKALHESEERYRMLSEVSPDQIFIVDQDHTLRYANTEILRMLCLPLNQVIGRSLRDLFPPDTYAAQSESLKIAFETEEPVRREEKIRYGNRTFWIDTRLVPLKDTKGNVSGVLGIARDITGKKRSEEELQDSRDFLNAILNTLGDPVYVKDREHRLILVNDAACRIFHRTRSELIGRTTQDLFADPSDAANSWERDEEVFSTDSEVVSEETNTYTPGRTLTVLVRKAPFTDKRGNQFIVGITSDVTERTQIEKALRESNKKMKLLTSITRHDINNQLGSINGFLGLLNDSVPDPALSDYFDRIRNATSRISSMIEFTRMYDRIGIHDPAWQDVRAIVQKAGGLALSGSLRLENGIAPGCRILADPMLEKVFANLADNTVRHGEKTTAVHAACHESCEGLTIVWEDDGIGIPDNEKELIFDRGYGRNTGYGLFLAREILAITGIGIRETGKRGKGARFEIIVPKGGYRLTTPYTDEKPST